MEKVDEMCNFDRIKKILDKKNESQSQGKVELDAHHSLGKEEITDEMYGALDLQIRMKKL